MVLSKNKSEKRQNVVGKSVTHSIAPPELLFCSQLAIGWFANILEGWKKKIALSSLFFPHISSPMKILNEDDKEEDMFADDGSERNLRKKDFSRQYQCRFGGCGKWMSKLKIWGNIVGIFHFFFLYILEVISKWVADNGLW